MQAPNTNRARLAVVLPLSAVVLTSLLVGCKGKDDADNSASTAPATGASTPGAHPGASPGTAPGGPGGTMMNKPTTNPAGVPGDMAITAKVKSALIKDTIASTINVNTKSGTVVLEGKTANATDKAKAVADAKKIEGVKNVIDHLSVKP